MDRAEKQALGTIVRQARVANGLSQEKLGMAVHKTGQTIANIEAGRRTPTLYTLKKLSVALGMPLKDFFEFGPMQTGEEIRLPRVDAEQRIRSILPQLSDEDVELLARQAVLLLEFRREQQQPAVDADSTLASPYFDAEDAEGT